MSILVLSPRTEYQRTRKTKCYLSVIVVIILCHIVYYSQMSDGP